MLQESGEDRNYNASTYAESTPALLNLLLGMLDEADCIIKGKNLPFDGGRIPYISDLNSTLTLHDSLSRVCLPLGLASMLIAGDQPVLSNTLWVKYLQEKEAAVARYRKGKRHITRDVYFS